MKLSRERRSTLRMCASLDTLCFIAIGASSAQVPIATNSQNIERLVVKVRRAKDWEVANREAEHLAQVVLRSDKRVIQQRTLERIVALLDTDNDGVRYSVAVAIGAFGHRAAFAAPRLLEVLKETDCVLVDSPSSLAIKPALKNIGAAVPPTRECTTFTRPKMPLQK